MGLMQLLKKCVKCGNKCNRIGKRNKYGDIKIFCCEDATRHTFPVTTYCNRCASRKMKWL